jgi:hypothetical protein
MVAFLLSESGISVQWAVLSSRSFRLGLTSFTPTSGAPSSRGTTAQGAHAHNEK